MRHGGGRDQFRILLALCVAAPCEGVGQIRRSRCRRDARSAAHHDAHPIPVVARGEARGIALVHGVCQGGDRKEDRGRLAFRHAHEALGCHSDYGGDERADLERLPEHVGAAQLPLPEAVAEHGDVLSPRHRILGGHEEPAGRRLRIEEAEERRADPGHLHLPRVAAAPHRQPPFREPGILGEGARPPPQVEVARVGEGRLRPHAPARRGLEVDATDGGGVAEVRERPEHEPVDHAEHRRVGADSECQREHHRRGEAGRSPEAAQCESYILADAIQRIAAPPLTRSGAPASRHDSRGGCGGMRGGGGRAYGQSIRSQGLEGAGVASASLDRGPEIAVSELLLRGPTIWPTLVRPSILWIQYARRAAPTSPGAVLPHGGHRPDREDSPPNRGGR